MYFINCFIENEHAINIFLIIRHAIEKYSAIPRLPCILATPIIIWIFLSNFGFTTSEWEHVYQIRWWCVTYSAPILTLTSSNLIYYFVYKLCDILYIIGVNFLVSWVNVNVCILLWRKNSISIFNLACLQKYISLFPLPYLLSQS